MPRPVSLRAIVGQTNAKTILSVAIKSSKERRETIPHILLSGPPGTGKTTLARVVANERNVPIQLANGSTINSGKDILTYLNKSDKNNIIFIDEIHRLGDQAQEVLYTAMEDFRIDLSSDSMSCSLDIKPFTLIGATTEAGSLLSPLRDRFTYQLRLELYSIDELIDIINRYSTNYLNINLDKEATTILAERSRGTPRIAIQYLLKIRDFYVCNKWNTVTREHIYSIMTLLGIDDFGFTREDRLYLEVLKKNRGPMGLKTISDVSGLDIETIQGTIEPWLMQQGKIRKTPKGRELC